MMILFVIKTEALFLFILFVMAPIMAEPNGEPGEADDVFKRRFKSYYNNYLDEMAESVCASIPSSGPGDVYAVRRKCGASEPCSQICTGTFLYNKNKLKWLKNSRWECLESLHVYKYTRILKPNNLKDTDPYQLGPQIYRYYSCGATGCGPNYCCCRHY